MESYINLKDLKDLILKYEAEVTEYAKNLQTYYREEVLTEKEKLLLSSRVKEFINFVKNYTGSIVSFICSLQEPGKLYLVSMNHCYKSYGRALEKVFNVYLKTGDIDAALMSVEDWLRFTFIVSNPDEYVNYVNKIIGEIENQNIKVCDVFNMWGAKYYQGLNVIFQTRDLKMEVQFHTENSYMFKEQKTRYPYIVIRNSNSSQDIIDKANFLREYYQMFVIPPKGAQEYEYKSENKVMTKRSFF